MKRINIFFGIFAFSLSVYGQGTFVNLNFESAGAFLSPVPAGQYGGEVSSMDAFPGWTVYYGTQQANQVLQNNYALSLVNVSILGPVWTDTNTIPGAMVIANKYSALLESGYVTGGFAPAILEQTGQVPASAQSLRFLAAGNLISQFLSVSFDGQNLTYVDLGAGPNGSEQYGANISIFADQTGLLSFTENPSTQGTWSVGLDNIVFSTSSIPEPGTLALLLCGVGLLGGVRYANSRLKT